MRASRYAVVLILASLLAACAQNQGNKQTVGTLLGAGTGALLGSQMGKGKGKLAMVAIGALGGAFLGSEIGKFLDQIDKQIAARAQIAALETGRSGTVTRWVNPDTEHSARVTTQPSYRTVSSVVCREYEHEVTFDGRRISVKSTACRHLDGSWRTI